MMRRMSPILPPIATLAESDFSDSETESWSTIPSSPLSPDFMSNFLDRKDRFNDHNYDQLEDDDDRESGRHNSRDDVRDFKRDMEFDVPEFNRSSGPVATPIAPVVALPVRKIDRRDAASTKRDLTNSTIGGTTNGNQNPDSNGYSYRLVTNGVRTPGRLTSGNHEGRTIKDYKFRHYNVKHASSDDTAHCYAPDMHTEPAANIPPWELFPDEPRRRARARSFTCEPTIFRCVKPDCDERFKTLDDVVAHTRIHRGEFGEKDSVRCPWPDCDWTSNMVGNAKRHYLVIKHKEKGYVCDDCSEAYTRKDALKRHRQLKHANHTDEEAALDGMMMLLRH